MKNISQDEAEIIEYASNIAFHQQISIPATRDHGILRVTYAVVGVEDKEAPTILFCGGMFGGRWLALCYDYLAQKMGVRLICTDRPGMGGSTPVELEKRMSIWLETVPLLLSHLDINRVVLASHCAGTLYLLNTLYHYPHLMSPTKPYAALICPWVHPTHSHVTLMSAAMMVPNGIIGYFDQLTKAVLSFITNTLNPALGVSGAGLGTSSGLLNSIPSLFPTTPRVEANDDEEKYMEMTGMSKEKATKFLEMIRMWIFTENTKGGNEEGLLCLKKSKRSLWGICEDYEEYATSLRSKIESDLPGARLKLHAFFAEDDMMIGNGGKEYFDKCWTPQICGDVIDYESMQLDKTDHDSIISPISGVLSKIFEEARVSLS